MAMKKKTMRELRTATRQLARAAQHMSGSYEAGYEALDRFRAAIEQAQKEVPFLDTRDWLGKSGTAVSEQYFNSSPSVLLNRLKDMQAVLNAE